MLLKHVDVGTVEQLRWILQSATILPEKCTNTTICQWSWMFRHEDEKSYSQIMLNDQPGVALRCYRVWIRNETLQERDI